MLILTSSFLGITLLSLLGPTRATETLPKEDFESVINKGLSDFMDQFGSKKKAELGIEDWVEKQRLVKEQQLKLQQEAAEAQRAIEEAERQKRKQEEEEKRKQEVLNQWNTEIETNIQYIKFLKNYDSTYGELIRILKIIKESRENHTSNDSNSFSTASSLLNKYFLHTTSQSHININFQTAYDYHNLPYPVIEISISPHPTYKTIFGMSISGQRSKKGAWGHSTNGEAYYEHDAMLALCGTLREEIMRKMEAYKELRGAPHPLWLDPYIDQYFENEEIFTEFQVEVNEFTQYIENGDRNRGWLSNRRVEDETIKGWRIKLQNMRTELAKNKDRKEECRLEVLEKMSLYKKLTGTTHPRWEEFCKM